MSERPENQGKGPRPPGDELFGPAPRPEQIWPPPPPRPAPHVEPAPPLEPEDEPIELTWPEEVEKIDEVIEEIRRINNGTRAAAVDLEEEPIADIGPTTAVAEESVPESVFDEEPDLAPPVVEESFPVSAAEEESTPATAVKRRVRAQSEAELGQLWSNVFYSVEHLPPKVVVVTAARRHDGATQIATALALLGAEVNEELRIALVDFNLRHPAIAALLAIPREPGLTDVLEGRSSLESALRTVTVRNGHRLHLLTSGPRAAQPLGLLKSRQAKALIARLRDRFDHVILDAANADVHPDSQALGAMADGALLVVQAGETPRETVAEVKKRMDLAGVRCLGLVMNQRSDPIPSLLYRMT